MKKIKILLVQIIGVFAYFYLVFYSLFRISKILNILRKKIWFYSLKHMGNGSEIMRGTIIHGSNMLTIGDRVKIGEYCHIWANEGLSVGNDSLIAAHCTLTTLTHDPDAALYNKSLISKPIVIGQNVWMGYGVRVLPGINIGDNSIIAAGSVITKNIPNNCLVAGVPAKVIRFLSNNSK
jgi:acetyltransferase-like isoleucine patch superfamily enzyme